MKAADHELDEHVRRAAVDVAEHHVGRAHEAVDALDLAGGQDDEDAEDRQRVEDHRGDRAVDDRLRHVLLRIDHLLGRAVRELEAHVVEEQQRHDAQEHQRARGRGGAGDEVAEAEAVDAVLERVDEHGEREEQEHEGPADGAEVRDPLAPVERRDGDDDADPDEDELEEQVDDRRVTEERDLGTAEVDEVLRERAARQEAERASDPERVRDPVEHGAEAGRQAPVAELHPLVRAALLGERRAQLAHDERVGQEEENREDGDPEERLGAERRDLAERVDADHRADREEQHVHAPQALLELALLLERKRRRGLETRIRCSHGLSLFVGWAGIYPFVPRACKRRESGSALLSRTSGAG